MLDPRIYRTGLVVGALAVLVLAFSLQSQPSGLSSSLPPDVFSGQNVYASMASMAKGDPQRRPGSAGDDALAAQLAASFRNDGFGVTTDAFTGRTADGTRTLENVVAVRPGMESGSVVIVAHRDARGSPALASLSATATLLELARDLEGESLNRTVVLASTSGSQGTAGAIRLASTLSGPIDAVIVLGDLASAHLRQPIVVPWSDGTAVAPLLLRNTLAAALSSQASLAVGGTSIAGQFAHLAFPFTISEQGPFGARGIPAVLLSVSGERGPAPDAPVAGQAQLGSLGRAVLQTITALDGGATVPTASPYILLDGQVVPGWALSLVALALIVPVLMTTVDGLARAFRRGYPVWRWVALVLATAIPFALAALVLVGARVTGLLGVAPPGPVAAGAVPLKSAGIAVLVLAGCVAVGGLVLLRPIAGRLGARARASEGAVVALLLVLVLATFAIWIANPFAALLLIPALHLWLLAMSSDLRLRLPLRLVLLLAGLVPAALIAVYYSVTLGFSPLGAVWSAALLIAGGAVTPLAVVEWSIVIGCALSAIVVCALAARQAHPDQAPITVRGPINYAGPGSLGGTKSALRR
jgi:hypothetical protein